MLVACTDHAVEWFCSKHVDLYSRANRFVLLAFYCLKTLSLYEHCLAQNADYVRYDKIQMSRILRDDCSVDHCVHESFAFAQSDLLHGGYMQKKWK